MSQVAITIRRANGGDTDFLAWVMLAASRAHLSRGIWDLIIGADDAGCLEYLKRLATAEPSSLCHFQSFLIAEFDRKPAAALSAFEPHSGGWATVSEAMSAVQRDLGWSEADLAASQARVAPVWSCFLPDAGADWGIENVATRPEFRRRGLAHALLDETLRDASERGCRLAEVITYIGNNDAQSAYESAGFRVSDQKRCSEVAQVLQAPGFVRMTRKL